MVRSAGFEPALAIALADDLALSYPHRRGSLPLPLVIAAAPLLVVISAVVLRFGRKRAYLITRWG
jgi:hypothetical protein